MEHGNQQLAEVDDLIGDFVRKISYNPHMPRTTKTKSTRDYRHDDKQALLRPESGAQDVFPPAKRKPPKTCRYDSSLAPELAWDEAEVRGEAQKSHRPKNAKREFCFVRIFQFLSYRHHALILPSLTKAFCFLKVLVYS